MFIKNNGNKKIITRGHGCSNGDQSVLEDGIVIDINNLNKVLKYDPQNETIEVETGAKLSNILEITLKDDLFFPCIPGGLDITVGGAVANNIHGKDCFRNGYFENNVSSIKMIDCDGNIIEISNNKNQDLYKNIFSMGLFGIIYSVKLKLKKIPSHLVEVITN